MRFTVIILTSLFLVNPDLHSIVYKYRIYNHRDVNKIILNFPEKIAHLPAQKQIMIIDNLYAFLHGYYRYIRGFDFKKKNIYYILKDNSRILLTDYSERPYDERLEQATLADVLHDPYPAGQKLTRQPRNVDPGHR